MIGTVSLVISLVCSSALQIYFRSNAQSYNADMMLTMLDAGFFEEQSCCVSRSLPCAEKAGCGRSMQCALCLAGHTLAGVRTNHI